MNLTDQEERKECPWLHCAHGLGVASTGSCYARGKPDDSLCEKFITDEKWEAQYENSKH